MKKINISQVDAIFANGSYPIEFLIYYRNKLSSLRIRRALKKISTDFWPVFGKYQNGIIEFKPYSESDYFEESQSDQKFDPDESLETIFETYRDAIPPLMDQLFFLKIIQIPNGTILIPKLNHLVGDGYSYFYFLSVLAALSRPNYVPFKRRIILNLYKPDHNRTVLKPFSLSKTGRDPERTAEKLTLRLEKIPRKDIHDMIRDNTAKLSTNDILSAIVLQHTIRNMKEKPVDQFRLTIPIDVRRQVKEYGRKYFGNGIMFGEIVFQTDEIVASNLMELSLRIRAGMPDVKRESFMKFLGEIESSITAGNTDGLRPYDPERGCLTTNLSKMPVTQLDFGTGLPDFVTPLTIGKNSAGILADKENFILRLAY